MRWFGREERREEAARAAARFEVTNIGGWQEAGKRRVAG
jgi:hypothetical protein